MSQFYCDALGFVVADRGEVGSGTEIVFLSGSSSDHHQFAVMSGRGDSNDSSLDHNAFRVGTIDDVKQMLAWVAADSRIGDGVPITHGNALSVYFADPEGNGIEVFCDTPLHVPQPIVRGWNPEKSNDEVLQSLDDTFGDLPGVMAMDTYKAERATALGEQP